MEKKRKQKCNIVFKQKKEKNYGKKKAWKKSI